MQSRKQQKATLTYSVQHAGCNRGAISTICTIGYSAQAIYLTITFFLTKNAINYKKIMHLLVN